MLHANLFAAAAAAGLLDASEQLRVSMQSLCKDKQGPIGYQLFHDVAAHLCEAEPHYVWPLKSRRNHQWSYLRFCRKVLHAGQSATVYADAKFGGPLHVEAMAEQQQVMYCDTFTATRPLTGSTFPYNE